MKRTVLFLMVIFLIIGACGCGMKRIKNEKNNITPYLEEKYRESFTLVSYEIRSIDVPYDEAVCVNVHGEKVKVYVRYEDTGVVMFDDYYGTLKMPEYYENLQYVLKEQNIACMLFTQFNANYFNPKYNHETPLLQAMEESKDQFYTRTTLFVRETEQFGQVAFERLCDILLAKNMTMYLAVYKVDESTYSILDPTKKASVYIHSENGDAPVFDKVIR